MHILTKVEANNYNMFYYMIMQITHTNIIAEYANVIQKTVDN